MSESKDFDQIMQFWANLIPRQKFALYELLALEYHLRTEQFDQGRCRCKRPSTGIAVPTTWSEERDCSRNASLVRQSLINEFFLERYAFNCMIKKMSAYFERVVLPLLIDNDTTLHPNNHP